MAEVVYFLGEGSNEEVYFFVRHIASDELSDKATMMLKDKVEALGYPVGALFLEEATMHYCASLMQGRLPY